MVIVCPITSNNKEFPTHHELEDTKNVYGSVLCEHIRSIDYEIRNLRFVEKLSNNDFISIITYLERGKLIGFSFYIFIINSKIESTAYVNRM